jgi:RNA polymerase sigma-B factor
MSEVDRRLASRRTDELFARWREAHDERARAELVEHFLPLARKLARRYAGTREGFDDLLQVASLGLLNAIDRFDPGRGTAFSSFAVPTMLGELKRYFRDTGWFVHVPRTLQERALKVQEAEAKLSARSGRSPTVGELAEYLEIGSEEVLEALEAAQAHHGTSLDAPIDDGQGSRATVADTVGVRDERLESVDALATIGRAARELPERDRLMLALYFLKDLPQTEIAKRVGVSQMHVSRTLRRSVEALSTVA